MNAIDKGKEAIKGKRRRGVILEHERAIAFSDVYPILEQTANAKAVEELEWACGHVLDVRAEEEIRDRIKELRGKDEVEVDAKGLLILDAETIIESGITCKTCDKWGVRWTGKSHGIERARGTTCWYDCEDDICGTGQEDFFCRLHSKLQEKK